MSWSLAGALLGLLGATALLLAGEEVGAFWLAVGASALLVRGIGDLMQRGSDGYRHRLLYEACVLGALSLALGAYGVLVLGGVVESEQPLVWGVLGLVGAVAGFWGGLRAARLSSKPTTKT